MWKKTGPNVNLGIRNVSYSLREHHFSLDIASRPRKLARSPFSPSLLCWGKECETNKSDEDDWLKMLIYANRRETWFVDFFIQNIKSFEDIITGSLSLYFFNNTSACNWGNKCSYVIEVEGNKRQGFPTEGNLKVAPVLQLTWTTESLLIRRLNKLFRYSTTKEKIDQLIKAFSNVYSYN